MLNLFFLGGGGKIPQCIYSLIMDIYLALNCIHLDHVHGLLSAWFLLVECIGLAVWAFWYTDCYVLAHLSPVLGMISLAHILSDSGTEVIPHSHTDINIGYAPSVHIQ